jgi:hypothetical protein
MKLRLPGDLKVTLPDTLLDPHVPVGVLGVVLALSGARFYRLAIVAPGFALGVLAGLQVPGSDEMRFVSAVALGIVCGALLHLLERVAIAVGGAFLTAGIATVATPLVTHEPNPWYVPVAGALVGLFFFPTLYKKLLPLITSIMGGLCVAWSLGVPEDLRVVAGVAAIGILVQLGTGGIGAKKGDKAPKEKKK